ncbi:MAG: outer membrane beta-barrel protein [Bacteroides sp.]|nr:outer membrane beta-barrel protein [Bacteroides sp.]
MKKLLFILSIGFSVSIVGQNFQGVVLDKNTFHPIEYVNLAVLERSDSSFISGTVSQLDGSFSLNILSVKEKILRLSCIGYSTEFLDMEYLTNDTLTLSPETTLLGEVVIKGNAKVHKLENNGISTDVQNSILKHIGTASDVLGQLPFVFKEGESFEIFGRGTPLIYINNRLMRNNSELAEINSSNIKKVTLITDPGPEYPGEVKAVIKIETIRQVGEGLSGSSYANIYLDRKFSHSEMQTLNYRIKNWDIFGLLRFSQMKDLLYKDSHQSVEDKEMKTELDQIAEEYSHYKSLRVNGGINYSSEKQSGGVRYEFSRIPRENIDIFIEAEVNKNTQFYEAYSSVWDSPTQKEVHSLNAYYSRQLFPWLSFQIDGDYYTGNSSNQQNVINDREGIWENIMTQSAQNYNLYAGKAIFTSPLWSGRLSYGGEYSHTYNKQSFYVDQSTGNENLKSSGNISKQNLLAVFAAFNKSFGKFSIDMGVRLEEVQFNYFSGGKNSMMRAGSILIFSQM